MLARNSMSAPAGGLRWVIRSVTEPELAEQTGANPYECGPGSTTYRRRTNVPGVFPDEASGLGHVGRQSGTTGV